MALAPSIAERPSVAAEAEEYFDILDSDGNPTGATELRSVVHATGLFHRAVYCFVTNSGGQLLLQQRSFDKKVGPGQWDLSVAEHLQPGEAYVDAAVRGLFEELGIVVSRERLKGPLGLRHVRKVVLPELGIYDNEYVESYLLSDFDGHVSPNTEEVIAVRHVALQQLSDELASVGSEERFTSWLRGEFQDVQLSEALGSVRGSAPLG